LTKTTRSFAFDEVIIKGANNLTVVRKKTNGITGQGITLFYPMVSNQIELESIADNYLTKNSQTITTVECIVSGDGLLQWGQTVNITYALEGITLTTFYILKTRYDLQEQYCVFQATSALVYDLKSRDNSRVGQLTQSVNDVKAIATVAKSISENLIEGGQEHKGVIVASADDYKKLPGVLGKDWVVGSQPAGLTTTLVNAPASTCNVIASYVGHNNVIDLYDNDTDNGDYIKTEVTITATDAGSID
jgi:hypothetical protein